jgi:chromatin remodeling complex protein RSC6
MAPLAVAQAAEAVAAEAAAAAADAVAAAAVEALVSEALAPDAAPSQPPASEKPAENPIHAVIDSISERIKSCMAQLKETDAMLKQLTKDTKKLCKKRAPSGKPSNLTLPLGISKELADFLAVAPETTITRSAVTKAINEYAVASGLKLPGNGRIIKLDDRLAALLGKSNGFEIPIINVQTHLRDHYVKLTPPPAAE